MLLTIPLAEVAARDAAVVGPKAFTLSRMLREGFPVPPGFCITSAAYREHIRRSGLARRIEEVGSEIAEAPHGRAALLAGVRDAIAGEPLAADLAEEIGRRWLALSASAVAVRSSATAEDLPGRSFAGQHDTYLGVTDLATCLRRVRDCWASLWSDRAFDYRCRHGVGHADAEMAVIVQSLVSAEAAGVMFTADPVSGRRDCAVIEAGFGLGEAVVKGMVTPDRVVVSKRVFRVECRATGCKTIEVLANPAGGVREQAVDAARASSPCLDDATAGRLALLGADLEGLLGAPQDVEWALADGHVHVLQARPITALPAEPPRSWDDRQIWTNVNLREVAPDVMTPMTYALIRKASAALFEPFFEPLRTDVTVDDVAGLVAGRLYFNVNTGVALWEALPLPVGPDPDPNILFGGGAGTGAPVRVRIPKEDLPDLRARWYRRLTFVPDVLWRVLSYPIRRRRGVLARFRARVAAAARQPWRDLGDVDLARRIASADLMLWQDLFAGGAMLLVVVSGLSHCLLLMLLCRRWLADDNGDLALRLLAGLGGMDDAEAGIALWRLASVAHGDAGAEAAIREESRFADIVRRLAGTAGGTAFLEAWADFMRAHGHHARGELEFSNARWAERPDYVLGLLRSHLEGLGRVDPVARARRLARERRSLARGCLRRLRNPLKRLAFEAVLRRAQGGLRFREAAKSDAVRWVAMVRENLLELGERFARRGILDRREDVFFLELGELGRAASGKFDPRPVVARRRRDYDRHAALDPPPVVFGRYDPERAAPEVLDARAGVLRGMGVSPGVAEGTARVILGADEEHVMPGEVLVAPVTDPAWTPYFVNAAAIVIDQGGQLSHGSILAREYGIPCVVNVGPASRLIRTGQALRVDGDHGLVQWLGRPTAAGRAGDAESLPG